MSPKLALTLLESSRAALQAVTAVFTWLTERFGSSRSAGETTTDQPYARSPELARDLAHLSRLVDEGRMAWAQPLAERLLKSEDVQRDGVARLEALNRLEMIFFATGRAAERRQVQQSARTVAERLTNVRPASENELIDGLRDGLDRAAAAVEKGYAYAEDGEPELALDSHEFALRLIKRWRAVNDGTARKALDKQEYRRITEEARRLHLRAAHNKADAIMRMVHAGWRLEEPLMSVVFDQVEGYFRESLAVQRESGRVLALTYVGLIELWQAAGSPFDIRRILLELQELSDRELRALQFTEAASRSSYLRELRHDPDLQPLFETLEERESAEPKAKRWVRRMVGGAAVVVFFLQLLSENANAATGRAAAWSTPDVVTAAAVDKPLFQAPARYFDKQIHFDKQITKQRLTSFGRTTTTDADPRLANLLETAFDKQILDKQILAHGESSADAARRQQLREDQACHSSLLLRAEGGAQRG